jgi:glyoxylase-like metal-dependent hydrolase (beta-lactamase superfamily II)
MSNGPSPYPVGAWPTYTYSSAQRKIFFNDEPIVIIYAPAARSDGDSLVFFRRSDVICAGDVFDATAYPAFEPGAGGSLAGTIAGLNQILDLMVPRYNQEGGTLVIPGHGRVGDQHDVLEYRDMLAIVRDRVRAAVRKGQTLAQVKAARPTLDYDARWGRAPGATDRFVEAVYAELAGER